MIVIEKLVQFKPGAWRFDLVNMDEDRTQVLMAVLGCKYIGDKLYGPSHMICGTRNFCTSVKFGGIVEKEVSEAVVRAIAAWRVEQRRNTVPGVVLS